VSSELVAHLEWHFLHPVDLVTYVIIVVFAGVGIVFLKWTYDGILWWIAGFLLVKLVITMVEWFWGTHRG
jgi:hypothetical protein